MARSMAFLLETKAQENRPFDMSPPRVCVLGLARFGNRDIKVEIVN